MVKRLMKGNEAAVYGALIGGCTHFFGYPITPASEIPKPPPITSPPREGCFFRLNRK